MKKIVVPLAISVLSLVFFLGILEVGLRVTGYRYYKKVSSVVGSSDVVSDSLKILCIGDSYTVGGRGLETHAYPNQLRSILSEKFGDKFNVVNGGICEINSTQALTRLSELSKGYSPDYLILLIGSANKFNLRGFNEYEGGKKNIFANLKVYRMFKILKTNLKGEFLKWKTRQHDPSGDKVISVQESQSEEDLIVRVSTSDKPLENKAAEKEYKKAIEDNPYNGYTYAKLARLYRGQDGFKKAEEFYKEIIAINPQGSWAYVELGHCYRTEGKFKQAQKAYEKGIELDPTQSRAYTGLGASYGGQGKFKEAETAYRKAIKVGPDDIWVYMALGNYYLRRGRFKDAQNMYKKAIELDPEEGRVYVRIANCYLEQGSFKDAVSFYEKAIELDPLQLDFYMALAGCYRQQGKFKKAEEFYKKVIESAPHEIWFYTEFAEFYLKLDRIKEAKEMFRKAIELDPSNSFLHVDLAECYLEQGKLKEAESLYKKAIELGPKDGWVYVGLGEIYIEQAEYSLAFEAFCKAIESDPEDFELYYAIFKAYELQSTYGSDYILEIFRGIIEKNPAVAENPKFRNYVEFYENEEKWEKKINKWLKDDLEAIAEFCRENNIKLIVQNYPYPYFSVNKLLEDLALKHSLPFVDNYSVFKELVEKEGREKYILDSDHCTTKGHAVMVENIYKVLVSEGIVKKDKERMQ